MEGSKVRIIHAGYDRTVPLCRVMPFTDSKEMADSEASEVKSAQAAVIGSENIDIENVENEIINADVRPKLHKIIEYNRKD